MHVAVRPTLCHPCRQRILPPSASPRHHGGLRNPPKQLCVPKRMLVCPAVVQPAAKDARGQTHVLRSPQANQICQITSMFDVCTCSSCIFGKLNPVDCHILLASKC